MEKWCSANGVFVLVFCPYRPSADWWNTISTLNLSFIKLRHRLSYLYRHRNYIGQSQFLTCIVFLGCTATEEPCLTVNNNHLGFWKPSEDGFFDNVRFPTQNLFYKRCLSTLER